MEIPRLEEIIQFFQNNGSTEAAAKKYYNYYTEYGTYEHYERGYQKDRYEKQTVIKKLNSECRIIRNLKLRCEQELSEEYYPEEYYLPEPLPAEELLATFARGTEFPKEFSPEDISSRLKDNSPAAFSALPDQSDDGIQLSIFDLYGDCL